MKYMLLLTCLIALFLVGSNVVSKTQDANSVVVSKDRFSNATVISLKPQTILKTPKHLLTISLDAKLEDKYFVNPVEIGADILGEGATVTFESSANEPTNFGDRELHFIVDSKKLPIGQCSRKMLRAPVADGYNYTEIFVNKLTTDYLKQLTTGKQVEMRLGSYEFTLSQGILNKLREYSNEFLKAAPTQKSKRRN